MTSRLARGICSPGVAVRRLTTTGAASGKGQYKTQVARRLSHMSVTSAMPRFSFSMTMESELSEPMVVPARDNSTVLSPDLSTIWSSPIMAVSVVEAKRARG